MAEAEIAPDATPPIDARQGLLFEFRIFPYLGAFFFFFLFSFLMLVVIGIGGGASFGFFSKRNREVDLRMPWFIRRCADPSVYVRYNRV